MLTMWSQVTDWPKTVGEGAGEQAAAEPAPTQFEETLSAPGAEDGEGAAEAETASTSHLSELSLEELQAELERRKSA